MSFWSGVKNFFSRGTNRRVTRNLNPQLASESSAARMGAGIIDPIMESIAATLGVNENNLTMEEVNLRGAISARVRVEKEKIVPPPKNAKELQRRKIEGVNIIVELKEALEWAIKKKTAIEINLGETDIHFEESVHSGSIDIVLVIDGYNDPNAGKRMF